MYYQRPEQAPTAQGAPGGGGAPAVPDYLKFQNVSPEMINFGLNAGQDMLKKQKERFMPGVSGFWSSLKYYFAVRCLFQSTVALQ